MAEKITDINRDVVIAHLVAGWNSGVARDDRWTAFREFTRDQIIERFSVSPEEFGVLRKGKG